MKRFVRLFFNVLIAAALAATAIHFVSGWRTKKIIAALDEPVSVVVQKLTNALESHPLAAASVKEQPDMVLQAKSDGRSVLLSEPVIILGGAHSQQAALPLGTQVALLESSGRYARVRHLDRVLTMPISAMRGGIYRTN